MGQHFGGENSISNSKFFLDKKASGASSRSIPPRGRSGTRVADGRIMSNTADRVSIVKKIRSQDSFV